MGPPQAGRRRTLGHRQATALTVREARNHPADGRAEPYAEVTAAERPESVWGASGRLG